MLRLFLAVGLFTLVETMMAKSARAEPPLPTLEVRATSLNRLAEQLPTFGEMIGQREAANQMAGLVQAFTDPQKGLEGFDPARPVGMYATVTPQVINSPVIVMLPVQNEKAVLALMTEKLGLKPEPQDGKRYQVALPNLPLPVYFRFAHRYLYVTVMNPEGIEPRQLITPEAFFPKSFPGLFRADLHLDRIPNEVTTMLFGQFELRTEEAKQEPRLGKSPAKRKLWQLNLDALADLVQTLIRDGKSVSFQVGLNTKSEELVATWSLTGKPGSPLAQALASPRDPSRVYGMTRAHPQAAVTAYLNLGIPRAYLPAIADWYDLAAEDAVDNAKDSDKLGSRMVMNAFAPTVKSGRIDAGFQIFGPNDDERYTILGGFRASQGKSIEDTARLILSTAPKDEFTVKLDQHKQRGINFHELRPLKKSGDFDRFAHPAIWLSTAESFFGVEWGGDGQHVRVAAKATPADAPVAEIRLEINRILPLIVPELSKKTTEALTKEILGASPTEDATTVQLQVRTGTALTVEARVKAKAVRLLTAVDEAKKQQ